jgi:hypothetical protein
MPDRYFVLFLPDRIWQTSLDLMRVLCNPQVRSRAHVTVRGPYSSRPGSTRDWRKERDIKISIVDIGNFFGPDQNTVFLRCDSEEIHRIWWKRDYKSGIPHITIYDGSSREFAEDIQRVLQEFRWSVDFVCDSLQEYITSTRQLQFDLDWGDCDALYFRIFGNHISREVIGTLSDTDRIEQIRLISALLSTGSLREELGSALPAPRLL